ncbi:MAG: response regulator [Candidatus Helarchaeota archaeon]
MVDVLVVDDEHAICDTIAWILEKEGYNVTIAMDFESASNLIKARDFDIYFLDLVLPGGNGIDLIKIIKELEKKGVIIVITGYPNIPTLIDSIRLDAYDYIKKPINKEELKNIIKLALEHQNGKK